MQNVKKLLDEVKQKAGIETDYALAKTLGIRRQLVSSYYKGVRVPDNAMCLEIAKRTEKPLAVVIAAIELDAEKDAKKHEVWRKYYKSIGGFAASFMIAALLTLLSVTLELTGVAKAVENPALKNGEINTLQIMRLSKKIKAAISIVLHKLRNAFLPPCFLY